MTKKNRSLLVALTAVTLIGCEVPAVEPLNAPASPPAKTAQAEPEPDPEGEEGFLPDGRLDMSGVPDEPPMTSGVPRPVTPKDPLQGKRSRRTQSPLGTTMQALPWAKNKTIFDNVKKALDLYWAQEGNYPKSHEEFLEKVVEFNKIELPKLEPGDEYLYDPEDHTLKIWRPGEAG